MPIPRGTNTKRKENMIKQFEISTSVQKQIGDYLAANNTDLKTAMADETAPKIGRASCRERV